MATPSPHFSIEPVTDPDDFPFLAQVFDEALKADSFHRLLMLASPKSVYEDALKATIDALEDPNVHLFKAVVEESDGKEIRRKIVGTAHWFIGYISIPKVNPFGVKENPAPENLAPMVADTASEGGALREAARKAFSEGRTYGWNTYIGTIRGKKHIYLRRVAILPAYQGRGIASKLVEWGAEYADREEMVGWLNARPAGLRIYERFGWRAIGSWGFNIPGLKVEPTISMLRPRLDRTAVK